MTEKPLAICWFRQDLRTTDNPALRAAHAAGTVLPIYILDDDSADTWKMGGASRVWIHHALNSLDENLDESLSLYSGNALKVLTKLCKKYNVSGIYWNRCYEPWRIKRDKEIKEKLSKKGIDVKSFNGSLLWEPWENLKEDGTPYKVFTPFYKKGCLQASIPKSPQFRPRDIDFFTDKESLSTDDLGLLPDKEWHKSLVSEWDISEQGAKKQMKKFFADGVSSYKECRNILSQEHVSRLSPYLHFGLISPQTVWHSTKKLTQDSNTMTFLSELGWREFSYSLLYHNNALPEKNLQEKFDKFPWEKNKQNLHAWQQGKTGIPIIDAGMRELWQTGYMHNRVRMIVGSFLVKNLLLDWREGEKWFWDCLFDADLANNAASWQWIAGSGADAAPYFRIFNPVLQGKRFDPDGTYTRKYLPELEKIETKWLFEPWNAPGDILKKAHIRLGMDYPTPIVDLAISRERALAAFKSL